MNDQQDSTSLGKPDPGPVAPSVSACRTDSTRRRLAGLAIGTPVLMSLASRPVFGANCLSNMMSGNLSDPDRGECSIGLSPSAWNPADPSISETLGSKLDSLVSGEGLGFPPNVLNLQSELTIGEVLDTSKHEAIKTAHGSLTQEDLDLAQAIINAYLNASTASTNQYILTLPQLQDLSNAVILPPEGHGTLLEFLQSTWGGV